MVKEGMIPKKPMVQKSGGMEKVLIENFVSLQKVMTNLAVKFDSLSTQISKLLELFEISAKSLAEKGYSAEENKVAEKLDNLLEQNKIIAKGIALLHEKETPEKKIEIAPPVHKVPNMPQPPGHLPVRPQTPPKKVIETKGPPKSFQPNFSKKPQAY